MSFSTSWEDHYNNIAKARKDGFDVVFGDEKSLLLDLDSETQVEQYKEILPHLKKCFTVVRVEEWTSKSENLHVRIMLGLPLSVEIRIALQSALGSDPRRTLCEILQVMFPANPIALFKPTKQQEKF